MDAFYLAQIDKERCLSWKVEKPPCQSACPLDIDIEGYIRETARGHFDNALEIIRKKCPLPSICGRVCHHPCESACKRGKLDEALAIEALKRSAADIGQYEQTPRTSPSRPETVGIIGSGPAGLTAAHDLARIGYRVTVYEAAEEPGGMLALGIPEFKLPLGIVRKEIDAVKALGVEIKTGTRVGTDISFADLQKRHDALLIAAGLSADVQLSIPGADLDRIIYALSFLKKVKLGKIDPFKGKVAVIGGGNSAIDAARTALRLEAAGVHMISTRKRDDMPALEQWIRCAEDEGVVIHNSWIPEAFRTRKEAGIFQIDLRRVIQTQRDPDGRVSRVLDNGPGSTVTMEADHLVIATGQRPDLSFLDTPGIQRNRRGAIDVDSATQATRVAGVFAAGDIANGPRTVTDAMASGRRAAGAIDCYLRGVDPEKPDVSACACTGEEILPEPGAIDRAARTPMRTLPVEERDRNFEEVDLGFAREEAEREAARCLRCKTCLRCFDRTGCIALPLARNASKASPLVDARLCAGCGRCARACPYGSIHLAGLS